MITRIEAYHYRCFERLQLDVDNYQVLVGRNGAGKSTLIDIPALLGSMLERGDINDAFFSERGMRAPRATSPLDLVPGGLGRSFSLALEIKLPTHVAAPLHARFRSEANQKTREQLDANPGRLPGSLRYEIFVGIESESLIISQEELFLLPTDRDLVQIAEEEGMWGRAASYNNSAVRRIISRDLDGEAEIQTETGSVGTEKTSQRIKVSETTPALFGLSADMHRFGASSWLREFLTRQGLHIDLDLQKLRRPVRPPGRDYQVASNGSTLPWSVVELQTRPEDHKEWIDHISTALPLLEDVKAVIQEADNHAYLQALYRTGFKVNSIGLSDGTLTLLALSILPFLKNVPPFVTVEEPENGIHPKAIEVILESLQAIQGSQVWVTTHSPIVVAVTKPEDLLCLSLSSDKGVTVIRGSEHPALSTWDGIPSLEVLFNAGIL